MFFLRAVGAALAAMAIAASPIAAHPGTGITLIEIQYCAYIGDADCSSAIARFELRFPEGSGVTLDESFVLTSGFAPSGDLYGAGCTEKGLLCAQTAAVLDGGSICVKAVIDARSLPEKMFGNFLDLSAAIEPADPTAESCDFPGPATVRMYTNCIDPPSPGDVFRRGERGRFTVLGVTPPSCGYVPIAVEARSWGSIKAMYR